MIVNSDYGMPLVPEKKYPRSETMERTDGKGGPEHPEYPGVD